MLRCTVRMPSAAELAARGPLVDVDLRPHPRAAVMPGHDAAARVSMLVDTGATRTLVDHRVPESMGLEPSRFETIVGISGDEQLRPVYAMVMRIPLRDHADRPYHVDFDEHIISVVPRIDGYHGYGFVGRDVLTRFRLDYDGFRGTFSLIDEHTAPEPEHAMTDEAARKAVDDARRAERRRRKSERRARKRHRR
jgi:hypothetical protein